MAKSKLSGVSKASKAARLAKAKLAAKKAALLLALQAARKFTSAFKKREEAFRASLQEQLANIESLWEQTETLGGDLPANSVSVEDADMLSSEVTLANYLEQLGEAIDDAKGARTLPKL